ncbi:MAG: nitrous oxide reductase family maturation protein NosD [Candidatus Eisenbacteria bacterium]
MAKRSRLLPLLPAILGMVVLLIQTALPGCPTKPAVAEEPEHPAESPEDGANLEIRPGAEIESLLAAAPDGGTVRLARARYRLSRSLEIRRPVHLLGEDGTVLEMQPGASTSLFDVRDVDAREDGGPVVIERMMLSGNREAQRGGSGILLLSCAGCIVRDVTIRSFWQDGLYASDARECLFERIILEDCGRNGLSFGERIVEPASEGNRILGAAARDNASIGFDVEPGIGNRFEDCVATGNGSYGFSVGAGARSHGNALVRCRAERNGDHGINLWSGENEVLSCESRRNAGDGISIVLAAGNTISDCAASENGRHGIGLDRASGSLLRANLAESNGRTGLGDGIALVAGTPVYDNLLTGNLVRGDSHRYALVVTAKVLRTVLEGNSFEGPLSVAARDVTWR